MLRLQWGEVLSLGKDRRNCRVLDVSIEGRKEKAILYPPLTGEANVGDKVLLNTMALHLKLGTGGYHFVLLIEGKIPPREEGPGHIMKLRYTPYQIKVFAQEEAGEIALGERPLVVGISLHSMLAPFLIALKALGDISCAYIMTDGGALPIWLSQSVDYLVENGFLDKTITIGHAFGGDLEAINVYTALLLAGREKLQVAVVGPGPGHVGTGTRYGFSGIEQGEVLNASGVLGCEGIAIPRVSFADKRERHWGISHHSLTSLGEICRERVTIFLPQLPGEKGRIIKEQSQALARHDVIFVNPEEIAWALEGEELFSTMGRTYYQDPIYFLTSALAAWGAKAMLQGR